MSKFKIKRINKYRFVAKLLDERMCVVYTEEQLKKCLGCSGLRNLNNKIRGLDIFKKRKITLKRKKSIK